VIKLYYASVVIISAADDEHIVYASVKNFKALPNKKNG
jgi:hypothetical protein